MPTLTEVLDTAKKYNFEYAIVFSDEKGEVKVAIGLNGLTHKINDVINTYIELLNKFNVKFNKAVYEVKSGKEISIIDVPMFFAVGFDESGQNISLKPSGYM